MKFQAGSFLIAACISQAIAQNPLAPINPTWTKQYDLSKVPNTPTKQVGAGICASTTCGPNECEKCWESCGNCARPEDIYGCKKGEWALTFDDGPSEHTTELLDILDAANVKATFLMIGSQVIKFPEVVKRAHDAGHLIAQHTWSHPHLMTISNEQIVAEVRATEDAILNVTGSKTAYIRPPYGEADDRVKAVFTAMGYKNLLWNMDTLDWDIVAKKQDPAKILDSFQNAITKGTVLNAHNDPGFVSLQHDIHVETVKKVPEIEKLLAANGFHFVLANSCIGGPMYQNGQNSTTTASVSASASASSTSAVASSTKSPNSSATGASKASSTSAGPAATAQSANSGASQVTGSLLALSAIMGVMSYF
ncbi:chitin deacetylase [Basidiobolus ranarum]|uniref:Chitin deacetylase n=1 Tax=Basidiobolus ranarum TaxID=34480 RepID=A0ABR2W4D3_9FUNG